ncbi:ras-GEF domain-containing family member 1C [Pontoporia blainvillei]|uniref:Ras-GEF domain-containing family member 1C n=1 Tax=Pontoporia blainvillei TaxID=48723 RepID=A0ABX0S5R6_PONBL|nr:ras-GEF domain-containing family member 1C [Pontoporia blainvillei]
MPRTLSTSDMVTPGSLGPPHPEPTDGEQTRQPLLDGAPSSASLDTLIEQLVPKADYYPEKAYIFTFLLSSRLFIEPRELLAQVCHLCIEQQQLDKPVLDKAQVRKFGPKLLQLLAEWTEMFPRDFQEESTISHLKDVVGRIAPCDEAYRKRMHQLLQALHQKLAALGQGPESLLGTDKPISYRNKPPASIHRELLSICSDPYTLAQQLTHVELVSRPTPRSTQTQSLNIENSRPPPPLPFLSPTRSQPNPGPEPITSGPPRHLQRTLTLEQSVTTPGARNRKAGGTSPAQL